jgi:hypothetical protein
MTNNKMMSAKFGTVFADGSGAPAMVYFNGHKIACDYLGEIKLNVVSKHAPAQWELRAVRKFYAAELSTRASAAWFDLNAGMYAPDEDRVTEALRDAERAV